MTNLTEQEVCIGSLGQQKVYLHWSDVKDICTNAVSEAYEQTKKENTKLKELLKECKPYIQYQIIREKYVGFTPQSANVLHKINQVLGEK